MIRIVFEKQSHRFNMLFELYKRGNANIDYADDIQTLAYNHGLGFKSFFPAWKYLQLEGLIKIRPGRENYYASMTHKGIKAIEEVFWDENKRTEYFPPYREMMN
jgi:predicted transcriptional regulator